MVIDFHVHCFPDSLAAKAVSVLAGRANTPPRLTGTIQDIKTSMKSAGVDRSVVLSIATKPTQTETINTWSADIQDDNIIAFGSIHPDYPQWEKELYRIKDLGLRGIKFHPDYQGFYVDEERMGGIYRTAADLGLIMIFHAGLDIGLPPPYHCTPERMAKVVNEFPDGKFVAAHMGGYDYWDDVEQYLVGENIYLDTSYCIGAGIMEDSQAKRIIRNHGSDKILFATDSPWTDQKEQLAKLADLGLNEEDRVNICGKNAQKLLGI